jgi:hypothetical protein
MERSGSSLSFILNSSLRAAANVGEDSIAGRAKLLNMGCPISRVFCEKWEAYFLRADGPLPLVHNFLKDRNPDEVGAMKAHFSQKRREAGAPTYGLTVNVAVPTIVVPA